MEVFGVGPAELVLIMIVVLLVFGPDQLPEIAKKMGKATRDLRRSMMDINSEVNEGLKPFQELKELKDINLLAPTETQPSNLIVAEDPPPAPPPASPAPSDEQASPPAPEGETPGPGDRPPDASADSWSI